MSEKKTNIESGKNVELDGLTVINEGITLSDDKVEEKNEDVAVEAPVEETKEDASVPEVELPQDNNEANEEEAPVAEEPTVEEPTVQNEETVIPIDLPSDITGGIPDVAPITDPFIGQSVDAELPTEEQATDYQPSDLNNPVSFDTTNPYTGYDEQTDPQAAYGVPDFNSFANNGFSNFNSEPTDELPDGVRTALDMIQNEVKEVTKENRTLKNENDRLQSENDALKNENVNLQSQIQILKNEKANMQNSITNVQSRILDVFGASNLMNYSNPSTNVTQDPNPGLNQGNFGDDQMSNGGAGFPLQ